MKDTDHLLDRYLKEAMNSHTMTPSDGARKAFLKDAAALPPVRNKRRGGLFLSTALIVLTIFGIATWQVMTEEKAIEPAKETIDADLSVAQTAGQMSSKPEPSQPRNPEPISTIKPGKSETIQPGQVQILSNSNPPPASSSEAVKNDYSISKKSNTSLKQAEPTFISQPIIQHEDGAINTQPFNENSTAEAATGSPILVTKAETQITVVDSLRDIEVQPDTSPTTSVSADQSRQTSEVRNGKVFPSIGVYYTPEWMFNTIEGTKYVHNFGIEGIFNYGPFSIRTGAGLTIGQGTNELVVEYNDFLGTYNKLDSMDFTWDDPTQQYLPSYYLSRQDVWDSLLKLDYPKVVKRYTYLQIPLIFGYEFWNNERFSLGVRVGPLLSVLLGSKQLSDEYDPGQNRVIRINDISPGQVNLNWQVMGGLNASARLNRVLRFEVEPFVKYYFNSVYEKPVDYAKPWSIGIRAAFHLDL